MEDAGMLQRDEMSGDNVRKVRSRTGWAAVRGLGILNDLPGSHFGIAVAEWFWCV